MAKQRKIDQPGESKLAKKLRAQVKALEAKNKEMQEQAEKLAEAVQKLQLENYALKQIVNHYDPLKKYNPKNEEG